LITGCGTLGKELIKTLPGQLVVYDFAEDALWEAEEINPNIEAVLGDIRNTTRVKEYMRGCDVIINTAAVKHVRYAVQNPGECIDINATAQYRMLSAARAMGIRRYIQVSTDKVCHPQTIYGLTKLMGEMSVKGFDLPGYFSWRFGNFLGSQGSVFDKWKLQAKKGRIRLTDRSMNRFFITPKDVALHVQDSLQAWADEYEPGCVFIPQMNVFNMGIVADVVADKWDVSVEVVGAGKGEKLNEYIITEQEAMCSTVERKHMGYCIHPGRVDDNIGWAITSENLPIMSRNATEKYLDGWI